MEDSRRGKKKKKWASRFSLIIVMTTMLYLLSRG